MDINIHKAVKGATKPKDAPPKEKYLVAIRNYLTATPPSNDAPYALLCQVLLPKLNGNDLVVALKAHMVFHHLITDLGVRSYAFFKFIGKYYAAANRSSVDYSIGAGAIQAFPQPPSPVNESAMANARPPLSTKKSNAILKLTHSTTSYFKGHTLAPQTVLDDLNSQTTKNMLLPNLAHRIPQAQAINRLVSAYNRYIRERLLHFRTLGVDSISEKTKGTSIVDDVNYNAQDFSEKLQASIQCVIQGIRLCLACIFPDELLEHPLYAECYRMVSNDLSILFRFLNLALVIALQNFFTLNRTSAERTLFAYKEYTQTQIPDEVISFVSRAQNNVSDRNLEIPQGLRQDRASITALTRSLENYLYEICENEVKENEKKKKKMSDSDVSDFVNEQKSSSSSLSSSSSNSSIVLTEKTLPSTNHAPPPTPPQTVPLAVPPSVPAKTPAKTPSKPVPRVPAEPSQPTARLPSVSSDEPKDQRRRSDVSSATDRSFVRHTIHKSPFDPYYAERELEEEAFRNIQSETIANSGNGRFFNDLNVNTPGTSSTPQQPKVAPPPKESVQPQSSLRDPGTNRFQSPPQPASDRNSSVPSLNAPTRPSSMNPRSSPRIPSTVPPSLPPPALPTLSSTTEPDSSTLSGLPANFDLNDPTMENWKELFDSLNNPEATFSLKFDLAAALQNSIKLFEELQKNGGGTGAFSEEDIMKALQGDYVPPTPTPKAELRGPGVPKTNGTTFAEMQRSAPDQSVVPRQSSSQPRQTSKAAIPTALPQSQSRLSDTQRSSSSSTTRNVPLFQAPSSMPPPQQLHVDKIPAGSPSSESVYSFSSNVTQPVPSSRPPSADQVRKKGKGKTAPQKPTARPTLRDTAHNDDTTPLALPPHPKTRRSYSNSSNISSLVSQETRTYDVQLPTAPQLKAYGLTDEPASPTSLYASGGGGGRSGRSGGGGGGAMDVNDPAYNPYTAPPPPTMHEQLIMERYRAALMADTADEYDDLAEMERLRDEQERERKLLELEMYEAQYGRRSGGAAAGGAQAAAGGTKPKSRGIISKALKKVSL